MKKIKPFFTGIIISTILFGCSTADDTNDNITEENLESDTQEEVVEPEEDTDLSEEVDEVDLKETVTFFGIGDNLIHDPIIWEAEVGEDAFDFSPIYKKLETDIQNADLAYINQETIIGGDEFGYSGYPTFNTPSDMIPSLIDAGFNMATGSNNHTLDMGTRGVYNSVNYWNEYKDDIFFTGMFESQEHRDTIPILEKNGMTFSVLSYTYGTNGIFPEEPYFVNYFDADLITDDVERAKEVSDFVIVAAHWGDEHAYFPNQMQLDYAQLFADLGVDVVLGTHSHTIQPVEWLTGEDGNETLIIYSLGNAVASSVSDVNMLGGSISFDFVNEGDDYYVENVYFDPLVIHYQLEYNGDARRWYGYEIYKLDDYTDDLANSHGLQGYLENVIRIETFQNTVNEVIDEEFLR